MFSGCNDFIPGFFIKEQHALDGTSITSLDYFGGFCFLPLIFGGSQVISYDKCFQIKCLDMKLCNCRFCRLEFHFGVTTGNQWEEYFLTCYQDHYFRTNPWLGLLLLLFFIYQLALSRGFRGYYNHGRYYVYGTTVFIFWILDEND